MKALYVAIAGVGFAIAVGWIDQWIATSRPAPATQPPSPVVYASWAPDIFECPLMGYDGLAAELDRIASVPVLTYANTAELHLLARCLREASAAINGRSGKSHG